MPVCLYNCYCAILIHSNDTISLQSPILIHRHPSQSDYAGQCHIRSLIRKVNGHRVDAVSLISRRREAFSFEDVPKMTTARRADDLGTHPSSRDVFVAPHSTRDGIEERRPSTAAVKLGRALVQGRTTPSAGVDALPFEMLVLPGARELSAFLPQYAELLWRQNSLPFAITLGLAGITHGSEGAECRNAAAGGMVYDGCARGGR